MNTIDFICDSYHEDLSLRGGILVEECAALYLPFDGKLPKGRQLTR